MDAIENVATKVEGIQEDAQLVVAGEIAGALVSILADALVAAFCDA